MNVIKIKYSNFKVLKENNCQPRILYTAKIFFKNEDETNMFSHIGTYTTERICQSQIHLKEIIKEVIWA